MERIPSKWRPSEKFIRVCGRCGSEIITTNSTSVHVKRPRENMKLMMHLCEECYLNFLDDYEIRE